MNLFSQSKKILNRFILKTSGLIFVFIVAGNLIAIQSGITNQVSKIFYWEEGGTVAGEYTVAITAAGITHPRVVAKQTDFDQIKQHIANNEQPWRMQYDTLMTKANGTGASPSTWTSADCGWSAEQPQFDSRKNKGDSGARQLATLGLACVLSNDTTVCTKAKNHLLGWASQQNLDVIQCVGDQNSIHSVNSVILDAALSYDWLYNRLTSAEITQVSNWLSQAGQHVRSVHDSGSNRCHNKEAWDVATLAIVGLAIDNADMVNYALGTGSYASSSIKNIRNLIQCAIQDNGNVCDSVYHCNGDYSGGNDYLSHNMLLFEAITLSSIGGAENGYENYFQTQPKINAAFNFYGELFQTNNLDNLDYAGADFTQPTIIRDFNWLYYTGIYEMGYKYLPSNANIKNTLQDQDFNYYGSPTCTDCPSAPEYNQGIPRFCNQNNCSRWLKYPNLIFGQTISSQPLQTCAEQGGDVCLASETCLPPNSWLSAYGTTMCCSGTCQSSGIDCSSCGPWQNASSCNTNGCSGTKPREQTRTGCPTGCSTSQCVVDASCGGGGGGGGAGLGPKIKIADNARDPAIAIDKTGAAHIVYETNCFLKNGRPLSCDMMYVKYICQNQQGVIDESSRKKIGTGANARVAPDTNNNIHIAWDHPGISGREGIKYNRIENGNPVWTEGRLLFANPPGVEKARIVVDNNNEVYVSFQNMPHVSFVHFPTDTTPTQFTSVTNIDENPDSDPKGVRQGGIAVDSGNNVHFSWSHYPAGGYYRKYGNGTFYAVQRVTQGLGEEATSDFTSISVNKNNNEIVYVAQPGNVDNPTNTYYGHLWYKNFGTDVNNEKLSAYNFGTEVGLIDDGDHLNVEVAVDTRNISYVTFAGSNLKTQIEEEKDANGIPYSHTCGDNVCHWYYESFEQNVPGMEYCPNDCGHYAYYFTVDQSGVYSGEAAFRLTPGSVNNNQGGKKTNPVPAPARNQGVYVVFEDNAENINYNAYLISLDGADVCGQSQSLSLKADFNCDGKVDVQDFGILLSHWEKTEPPAILEHYANAGCANTNTPEKNLNLDCIKTPVINGNDFGSLLGCWGTPDPVVSAVCYGASQCQ